LNGEANSARKKQNSATIVADVQQPLVIEHEKPE
jgi:hypothetical protein